jgi:hypothetical protein
MKDITSGYSVFSHDSWLTESVLPLTISQDKYEEWKKTYTFRAIQHDTSYGKDFCKYFKINNFILSHTLAPDSADTYIKKHYIE